jgi:hypothetical protein
VTLPFSVDLSTSIFRHSPEHKKGKAIDFFIMQGALALPILPGKCGEGGAQPHINAIMKKLSITHRNV